MCDAQAATAASKKHDALNDHVRLTICRRPHDGNAAGADVVGLLACLSFTRSALLFFEYPGRYLRFLSNKISSHEPCTRSSCSMRSRFSTSSMVCVDERAPHSHRSVPFTLYIRVASSQIDATVQKRPLLWLFLIVFRREHLEWNRWTWRTTCR
jgi:hypothetical protein